jgi:hypothetical protein
MEQREVHCLDDARLFLPDAVAGRRYRCTDMFCA